MSSDICSSRLELQLGVEDVVDAMEVMWPCSIISIVEEL
jgi:hypothetical protein